MQKLNNMILWNDLPALKIKDDKYVVFSNLNGEFVACEISKKNMKSKKLISELEKQGLFNCLKDIKHYRADELTLILSLTEKCNCKCKYCFLEANIDGKIMTKELIHDSIDKAIEIANGRIINLSAFGGEPTTEYKLLKEMVDYSKKKKNQKFKYSITSNGVFNQRVLKLLIDNNFKVSYSMDGLPKVQNYQRPLANGKGSYEIVEHTLKELTKNNLDLKVRCTVTKYSVNRMSDTVEWLSKLGVKKVHFEPVTPGGRGLNNNPFLQPPTAREFSDNLIKSIQKGSEIGVDVMCFPYMNMLVAPIVFCDGNINNRLVVSPEGILSTCVEVQKKNHELFPYLGLGEYNFEERKFNVEYAQRRVAKRGCEALKKTDRYCNKCPLKFFCGGGCPTRNYRGCGNSEQVNDYRCDIIRLVMPYVLNQFYISTFKKGGGIDDKK